MWRFQDSSWDSKAIRLIHSTPNRKSSEACFVTTRMEVKYTMALPKISVSHAHLNGKPMYRQINHGEGQG